MRSQNNLIRFSLGILIGLFGAGLFFYTPAGPDNRAWAAQSPGASHIQVIPIQINRESQGICMVDTRMKTLWVYGVKMQQPGFEQIRLLAARSWEYDRQLTEWNCGEPTPGQIRNVIEGVQQQQMIESIQPEEPAEESGDRNTKMKPIQETGN